MDRHNRRKLWRRIERTTRGDSPPRLIKDWADLAEISESETHRLEIDLEGCNGWIHRKDGDEFMGEYLSTHTFYGSNYKNSTLLLRRCGFNVTCANWDAPDSKN